MEKEVCNCYQAYLMDTHHPPAVRERKVCKRRGGPNFQLHPHQICTRLLTHYFQFCSFSLLILAGESRNVAYVRHLKHVSITPHTGTEQQVNCICLPNSQDSLVSQML